MALFKFPSFAKEVTLACAKHFVDINFWFVIETYHGGVHDVFFAINVEELVSFGSLHKFYYYSLSIMIHSLADVKLVKTVNKS